MRERRMERTGAYRRVSFLWHVLLLALLVFLAAAAPSRALGGDCTKPTNQPRSEAGQPRNITGLKNELLYYHCSGTYEREFRRVIDRAISYVNARAKNGEKPALVLDIDETSLS